ncbi:hypothetical protein KC19_7G189400 [Ceratodon purpureus]|uniref:Uncharacterized protein n=1 Tax=Ceratodon purpureus TaxID=3225 RepID=A0A8T0HCI1_CERPU|nr:hypothetical protein KC19_7G189400 [Ceratodon purpureus]
MTAILCFIVILLIHMDSSSHVFIRNQSTSILVKGIKIYLAIRSRGFAFVSPYSS